MRIPTRSTPSPFSSLPLLLGALLLASACGDPQSNNSNATGGGSGNPGGDGGTLEKCDTEAACKTLLCKDKASCAPFRVSPCNTAELCKLAVCDGKDSCKAFGPVEATCNTIELCKTEACKGKDSCKPFEIQKGSCEGKTKGCSKQNKVCSDGQCIDPTPFCAANHPASWELITIDKTGRYEVTSDTTTDFSEITKKVGETIECSSSVVDGDKIRVHSIALDIKKTAKLTWAPTSYPNAEGKGVKLNFQLLKLEDDCTITDAGHQSCSFNAKPPVTPAYVQPGKYLLTALSPEKETQGRWKVAIDATLADVDPPCKWDTFTCDPTSGERVFCHKNDTKPEAAWTTRVVKKCPYSCVDAPDTVTPDKWQANGPNTCLGNTCSTPLVIDGSSATTKTYTFPFLTLYDVFESNFEFRGNEACLVGGDTNDVNEYKYSEGVDLFFQVKNLPDQHKVTPKVTITDESGNTVDDMHILVAYQNTCGALEKCVACTSTSGVACKSKQGAYDVASYKNQGYAVEPYAAPTGGKGKDVFVIVDFGNPLLNLAKEEVLKKSTIKIELTVN